MPLPPMIEQKKETLDSLISYSVGGGGVSLGIFSGMESQINLLILIFSLIIVLIRLCYDGLKFFDYLKTRK